MEFKKKHATIAIVIAALVFFFILANTTMDSIILYRVHRLRMPTSSTYTTPGPVPSQAPSHGSVDTTNVPTLTPTTTGIPSMSPTWNVTDEYETTTPTSYHEYETSIPISVTEAPTLPFAGVPEGMRISRMVNGCQMYSVNYSILNSESNKDYSVLNCGSGGKIVGQSPKFKYGIGDYRVRCLERCLQYGKNCQTIQRYEIPGRSNYYRCFFLSCNPYTPGSFYADTNDRKNRFVWLDETCYG